MEANYIFTEPQASRLARLRITARGKHRIVYDCLNAIVDGDRVKCKKGNIIGRGADGSIGLISVLAGRTALVCQDCKDYDADEVTAKIVGEKVYD